MFRLTAREKTEVVTNCDHLKHLIYPRVLPHAFTEHGAVMLASVLNSPLAVKASIQVVRAFVRLRQVLASHDDLRRRVEELERKYEDHDDQLTSVFQALRDLIEEPDEEQRPAIGYATEEKGK